MHFSIFVNPESLMEAAEELSLGQNTIMMGILAMCFSVESSRCVHNIHAKHTFNFPTKWGGKKD